MRILITLAILMNGLISGLSLASFEALETVQLPLSSLGGKARAAHKTLLAAAHQPENGEQGAKLLQLSELFAEIADYVDFVHKADGKVPSEIYKVLSSESFANSVLPLLEALFPRDSTPPRTYVTKQKGVLKTLSLSDIQDATMSWGDYVRRLDRSYRPQGIQPAKTIEDTLATLRSVTKPGQKIVKFKLPPPVNTPDQGLERLARFLDAQKPTPTAQDVFGGGSHTRRANPVRTGI